MGPEEREALENERRDIQREKRMRGRISVLQARRLDEINGLIGREEYNDHIAGRMPARALCEICHLPCDPVLRTHVSCDALTADLRSERKA